MTFDMGHVLDFLRPEERLAHYRELAKSALKRAVSTPDPAIRTDLLNMAAGWHLLITEMEKTHSAIGAALDMPRKASARN